MPESTRDISAVTSSLSSLTRSFASELAELEQSLSTLRLRDERIKLAASAVMNSRKNGTDNEVLLAAALLVAAVLGPEAMKNDATTPEASTLPGYCERRRGGRHVARSSRRGS